MMQITMFQVFYTDRITNAFQPDYFALSGIETIKSASDYLNKRNGGDAQIMSLVCSVDRTFMELHEVNKPI